MNTAYCPEEVLELADETVSSIQKTVIGTYGYTFVHNGKKYTFDTLGEAEYMRNLLILRKSLSLLGIEKSTREWNILINQYPEYSPSFIVINYLDIVGEEDDSPGSVVHDKEMLRNWLRT